MLPSQLYIISSRDSLKNSLTYAGNYETLHRTGSPMKLCKKCNTSKHSYEFYSNLRLLSGLSSWCCECIKSNAREWIVNNRARALETNRKWKLKNPRPKIAREKLPLKILRLRKAERQKECYKKNPKKFHDIITKSNKKKQLQVFRLAFLAGDYGRPYWNIYRGGSSQKQRKGNIRAQLTWAQSFRLQKPSKPKKPPKPYDPVRQRVYSLSVRERDRAKRNRRRAGYRKNMSDVQKLSRRMSNSIGQSLSGKKAGRRWQSLVGYTVGDLRKHLESLFQPGMTWDNYGVNGWHIDHVFPQSRLIMDGPDDPTFRFCWSLLNLQPLWSDDNIDKADLVV